MGRTGIAVAAGWLACLAGWAAGQETAGPQSPDQGAAVQRAVERLCQDDVRARWQAAYALGELGPAATEAVPALITLLENQREHEYVRGSAAWALGRIGPKAEAAAPLLRQTLASKHLSVRRAAAQAVGELGDAATPLAADLGPLLADPDPIVRIHAACSLFRINRSEKALDLLFKTVEEGKQHACEAAIALGSLRAEAAIDPLCAALASSDADLRRSAADALGKIGMKAAPSLRRALASDSAPALGAVEAFAVMGKDAQGDLITALKSSHPAARRAAARALGSLGPVAADAEGPLVELLNDSAAEVKAEAAKALRQVRGKE